MAGGGGACTTAESPDRKPPRAEITCKNNNGREYRITRLPGFHSVIGFRVCESEKKKERKPDGERDQA